MYMLRGELHITEGQEAADETAAQEFPSDLDLGTGGEPEVRVIDGQEFTVFKLDSESRKSVLEKDDVWPDIVQVRTRSLNGKRGRLPPGTFLDESEAGH